MKNFEAASSLALELTKAGFTLTAEGGRLRVAPAGLLTDELREAIRRHRDDLFSLVQNQALQPAPADGMGIGSTEAEKVEKIAVSGPANGVVTCGACLRFQPNTENPARGLGRCCVTPSGLPPSGGTGYRAPYPFSRRTCSHFVAKEAPL
ncbi:MAG: hypothetical protein JJ714_05215 [Acidithiobacillus sp.]|nr:hypothetical protein [Acidithiobacillus sp.]